MKELTRFMLSFVLHTYMTKPVLNMSGIEITKTAPSHLSKLDLGASLAISTYLDRCHMR